MVYNRGENCKETMAYGGAENPYALSAQVCEQMLNSLNDTWNVTILRYFNAIGIHPSGELSMGDSENIMPIIERVVKGKQEILKIYGNDWETLDGTCIRDYVHILDIVQAHILCLKSQKGKRLYNVGSNSSISVQDFVVAAEESIGRTIPKEICGRRQGDVPILTADINRIKEELGWSPRHTLQSACDSVFRKQKMVTKRKTRSRSHSRTTSLSTSSRY